MKNSLILILLMAMLLFAGTAAATTITASNTTQYSSVSQAETVSGTMELVKEINITQAYTGSWRISFDMWCNAGDPDVCSDYGTNAYGQIYKNGYAYGTIRTTNSPNTQTYSQDFSSININISDKIQIYAYNTGSATEILNFKINFDVIPDANTSVNSSFGNNSGGSNDPIFPVTYISSDYQPVFDGITQGLGTDGITASHLLRLCRITPTDNWVRSQTPGTYDCDKTAVIDLKGVPKDNIPSGGNTNRISPSEMLITVLKLNNYAGSGTITYKWTNKDTNQYMYSLPVSVPACAGNCGWQYWYYESYSFIGHFSWEIHAPGNYSVDILTSWGNAKYDFQVIDTTPASTFNYTFDSNPAGASISILSNSGQSYSGTAPYSFTADLRNGFTATFSKTGYVDKVLTYTTFPLTTLTATLTPVSSGIWSVDETTGATDINLKACAGSVQGWFYLTSPKYEKKYSTYINPNQCMAFSIPISDMQVWGTGAWIAAIFDASNPLQSKAFKAFEVLPVSQALPELNYTTKSLEILYQPYYINSNVVAHYQIAVDYNQQGSLSVNNYEYKVSMVDSNGTEILYTYPAIPALVNNIMVMNNTVTFGNYTPYWEKSGGYSIKIYEIRKSDNRNSLIASKMFLISSQTGCNTDPLAKCNQPGAGQPGTNQPAPSGGFTLNLGGLFGIFSGVDPFTGFIISLVLMLVSFIFVGVKHNNQLAGGLASGGMMLVTVFVGLFPWTYFLITMLVIAIIGYALHGMKRGEHD